MWKISFRVGWLDYNDFKSRLHLRNPGMLGRSLEKVHSLPRTSAILINNLITDADSCILNRLSNSYT